MDAPSLETASRNVVLPGEEGESYLDHVAQGGIRASFALGLLSSCPYGAAVCAPRLRSWVTAGGTLDNVLREAGSGAHAEPAEPIDEIRSGEEWVVVHTAGAVLSEHPVDRTGSCGPVRGAEDDRAVQGYVVGARAQWGIPEDDGESG